MCILLSPQERCLLRGSQLLEFRSSLAWDSWDITRPCHLPLHNQAETIRVKRKPTPGFEEAFPEYASPAVSRSGYKGRMRMAGVSYRV